MQETLKLQKIASNPKNSAWVFASAGSGKTTVLTNRVLRLLFEGVSPNKILCLTFTNVGAAEMQNRINEELAKWVLYDDEALIAKLSQLKDGKVTKEDLTKARTLFVKTIDDESKIKIQTIHSFCQNLIRIFPFESEVKPDFEMIEPVKEKLLLSEARKKTLIKAENNDELKQLITKINSKIHEESFLRLVLELLDEKEQLEILKERFFGIEGIIDEIYKNLAVEKNTSDQEILNNFLGKINKNDVLDLARILENSESNGNKERAAKIIDFINNPNLEKASDYKLAFLTKEDTPRKIAGKVLDDANLAKIFNQQIRLIFEFFEKLNSYKICSDTALLLKFTDEILNNYNELKKQNSFLDYNDLIIKTNKLLENPDFADFVKLKMDGFFDHILIDESQDTNHYQWNIIKSLTDDFFSGIGASNANRTIFIVGDEKQSIYSFQGAEPNISEEIFSYFANKMGNNLQKISLDNSFRSLTSVLKAVDATFAGEKEKSAISKISDFHGHKAIREGVGKVEILPQIKLKKKEKTKTSYEWKIDFTEQEDYEEQEFLAEFIALKIKSLVEKQYVLEGRNRAVKYGDFMILLRNRTNGFDRSLTKFLQKYDIPNISSSKIKFSYNIIIQDLLSASKFALFPYDDLNLATLLKSPIFNISEEDLFEICKIRNSNSTTIYNALEHLPKFSNLKNKLRKLIENSHKLNSYEFFDLLLKENNNYQKILNHFGAKAAPIVDEFLLETFNFYRNFSANLHIFLDFTEKLDPELSPKNKKDNHVLISTVHSAKGLQAPIVILPDCSFNFNQLPAMKEKISFVEFENYKLPLWCAKKENENDVLKKHRHESNKEIKDEYLRLLYVAMTRAENELYVGGFGNSSDEDSWYNLIKKSLVNQAWKKEFFNDENKFLKQDKFEINNVIFGIGKDGLQTHESLRCAQDNTLSTCNPEGETRRISCNFSTPEILRFAQDDRNKDKDNKILINKSQIKGKLIHKVLELIGQNAKEDKIWLKNLCEKVIRQEKLLNKTSINEAITILHNFLDSSHFQDLFSEETKCEVPIVGNINNQIINGRIDLLVIKNQEILIIDYKTDKKDVINSSYIEQLGTYRKLIQNLYQNHQIKTAILWLETLELQFL
ncbi:MAG: UvrD-helicase domain-containing protein [Rickettsiales bacterium]|nr:UvrD-helicase domain-containing protein [Rickettsiales bacterium]